MTEKVPLVHLLHCLGTCVVWAPDVGHDHLGTEYGTTGAVGACRVKYTKYPYPDLGLKKWNLYECGS